MDWQRYLTPWNIGGAVFGVVLGAAAIVSLVMNRHQLGTAFSKAAQRLFSPVGFFGLVIVVFMCISTLESGAFFDRNITHGAIFGLLGYALALGFDLVSVVCMQARLNATRMRDERGAHLNLVGVCLCAAASDFANVAGAIQDYQPAELDHTPAWIQACAPWTSMVFPALIVVLSMTTDHILDHTPARGIDLSVYKEHERKRVEVLRVRLDTERELLTLDAELSALRQKREQASGRVRREWIWIRWLHPIATPPARAEEHDRIDQAVQAAQAALEERLSEVDKTLNALTSTATEVLSTLCTQGNTNAQEQEGAKSNDLKQRTGEQHIRPPAQGQRGVFDEKAETEEGTNAGPAILAAFQRLGSHATDTDVAHEVGYSRTTVARWRKRLIAQGQLAAPATNTQLLQITESAG